MGTTRFLKAFWALTKPYWVSKERRVGLILLATVIGLTLMGVSSVYQILITGMLVILAVGTDQLSRRGAG